MGKFARLTHIADGSSADFPPRGKRFGGERALLGHVSAPIGGSVLTKQDNFFAKAPKVRCTDITGSSAPDAFNSHQMPRLIALGSTHFKQWRAND
jgi:hypothetical protein